MTELALLSPFQKGIALHVFFSFGAGKNQGHATMTTPAGTDQETGRKAPLIGIRRQARKGVTTIGTTIEDRARLARAQYTRKRLNVHVNVLDELS